LDRLADNVNEAAESIAKHLVAEAHIGLVLGSGLGDAVSGFEKIGELPYDRISHFPVSGVKGHAGKLLFCRLGGKPILVLQGRFHYYEGYTMRGVTFPIRVLRRLGVEKLVLTNAAGGLNPRFKPGDLMLVSDHLNMMGVNPLIGVVDAAFGSSFVDLRNAYDDALLDLAEKAAAKLAIKMQKGVLAAVSGPAYETKAEARFLANAGADAVTMSTVPETIVARQGGMKVLAVSCITNSLWQEQAIGHDEVLRVGQSTTATLSSWLKELGKEL
jgi:purine-nucleoside phosphorylase